ncbi:glycosyltransferase family 4 protein [Micromonospora sp. DR5-3]|uniref:glycosyltransferase family 4 protein n=1 Tax=unclassified Micromonospora TaxID=2617518 RepID=UPI0011D85A00|nr:MULTISPECIES: glycosyltransferase family 4 protein [unclassified Micromonospora]MCW3815821.1 glycosyltransferase family 4 protein [Micromonospora sp. DR5-3]TYC21195.1 glycosyltransferase family 4 protein [Micromonospora sp. MP36]
MKVLLGPAHELHDGVHGSLLDSPPTGTTYMQAGYTLRFRPDRSACRAFSPLHDAAVAEWVRFDDLLADVDVVHSSRLPVETARPWVVDADCLLMPLQAGRFYTLGAASRGTPLVPNSAALARREAAMAARYASGRCARILFRTEYARRACLEHLAAHGHRPEVIEKLSAKSEVVYPAIPALHAVRRSERPVTVLYMGRTAQDKGASTAVEVFGRLRARHGEAVRLVFLGPCPEPDAHRLLAAGVELVATLPRPAYLEQLRRADIFLSPTSFESFGMGLVEAAAAGLAVVCSTGPGMEHIGELFTPGDHALFVSNAEPAAPRTAAFTEAASRLIDDASLRRRLAVNNRALTTSGRLSLRQRDERLGAAYAHAASLVIGRADPADDRDARVEGDRRITDWADDVCRWAGQHCTARIGGRVIVRYDPPTRRPAAEVSGGTAAPRRRNR